MAIRQFIQRWGTFAALVVAQGVLTHGAWAQGYPAKPINIVVAYPAGGAADFTARVMTKEMPGLLKTTMTVDNVAGVAGALGTAKVTNAAPCSEPSL